MATWKLLHYFTDHEVTVVTSYPLRDIVCNHDAVGWISKWALKLMGHELESPLGDSAGGIAVMDDLLEWVRGHDQDLVVGEVV